MTTMRNIDYEVLHENLINGNRTDVAEIINSSDNPAWSVLRLLREMAALRDPTMLLDDVVNLQGLVEERCRTK